MSFYHYNIAPKQHEVTEKKMNKLQQTLLTVQQLEKNLANLRKLLTNLQHQLSYPLTFQTYSITATHIAHDEHKVNIENLSLIVIS